MEIFMKMKKGKIFNKPGTDFEVRFVVIDYDFNGVYIINLNSKNKFFRKVKFISYEDLESYREE